MSTIADRIGPEQVSQLREAASQSPVCGCGRLKALQYPTCPRCARFVGPFVKVESPSGDYVEVGGIESAEMLINRHEMRSGQLP